MHEFETWVYAHEIAGRYDQAVVHESPLSDGKYVVWIWTGPLQGYWYGGEDAHSD